jgi:hypothetical protein
MAVPYLHIFTDIIRPGSHGTPSIETGRTTMRSRATPDDSRLLSLHMTYIKLQFDCCSFSEDKSDSMNETEASALADMKL